MCAGASQAGSRVADSGGGLPCSAPGAMTGTRANACTRVIATTSQAPASTSAQDLLRIAADRGTTTLVAAVRQKKAARWAGRTRGRGGGKKPRYQLQIEAMVAASHYEARDLSVLSPECQAILGFCRDWRSVAEISAVLRMPLGVARVLIGDMAMDGLVRVHQIDHEQGRPDMNLLEGVLSGLRKL